MSFSSITFLYTPLISTLVSTVIILLTLRFRSNVPQNSYYLFIIFIILSLFLSPFDRIVAWLPSSGISIYLISLFLLIEVVTNESSYKVFHRYNLSFTRSLLRKRLASIQDIESKKTFYIQSIKKQIISLQKMEFYFTQYNTWLTFLTFSLVSVFLFAYFIVDYIFEQSFIEQVNLGAFEIKNFFRQLLETQKNTDKKLPTEWLDNLSSENITLFVKNTLYFSFTYIFVTTAFTMFFLVWLFKKIALLQLSYSWNWLYSLLYFRLPINIIWLFIIGLFLTLLTFYFSFPIVIASIIHNFFFSMSFLYLLHGYSIYRLYTEARLLPFRYINLVCFFLFLFIFQNLAWLLTMCFIYFTIGLLDFMFDFRKKALHPKIIYNS